MDLPSARTFNSTGNREFAASHIVRHLHLRFNFTNFTAFRKGELSLGNRTHKSNSYEARRNPQIPRTRKVLILQSYQRLLAWCKTLAQPAQNKLRTKTALPASRLQIQRVAEQVNNRIRRRIFKLVIKPSLKPVEIRWRHPFNPIQFHLQRLASFPLAFMDVGIEVLNDSIIAAHKCRVRAFAAREKFNQSVKRVMRGRPDCDENFSAHVKTSRPRRSQILDFG